MELKAISRTERMKADIQGWLDEFRDVVRKEPGLIKLVKMGINTGDTAPISQHPYNTPVSLREAVEKEVNWLLD